MKKIIALALAFIMVFALATTAFAQTEGTASAGTATITISNAAKGETYSVYKLFGATVTGTENGAIAYTGDVPSGLGLYFTKDSAGNITATDAAKDGDKMSSNLQGALKAWAASATVAASAVSDGSELSFVGLPYGYYVITTSQGEQTISVDSTNPDAKIVDKNSTVSKDLTKTVDVDDVFIGQTVTYTVSFLTSNYDGAGEDADQIISYTIEDTLPGFLTNVNVTSIIIDEDGNAETTNDQTVVTEQFVNKQITIDWASAGTSLYKNGAKVIMTYTAVVADTAAIDGEGNTNTVTVTWEDDNDEDDDEGDKLTTTETIYTYAIALKKVNDKGEALAGATFQFPFYVEEAIGNDGAYIYAGTKEGDGLINEITTPDSGEITIKGVATGEYSITEIEAPNGYNKLIEAVKVTAVQTGAATTNTTVYLDENGNVTETETETTVIYKNDNLAATPVVVVNKTGAELPSTGGMGTTMFYVIGAVLMMGAVVVLVSRKRMAA